MKRPFKLKMWDDADKPIVTIKEGNIKRMKAGIESVFEKFE